jgi:hypothetical protein
MYALEHPFVGVGNGIRCPRQVNFEQRTIAFAQKAINLRGARVVRYSLVNP